MNFKQFCRTLRMDIKRSLKILPHILLLTLIFLVAGVVLMHYSSNLIYGSNALGGIKVAYHMPADSEYNALAVNMVENMESIRDTIVLIPTDSEEEGIKLVESGECYVFVNVPNDFIRGAYYGDNHPISLYFKGTDSFEEYAVNDLMINMGGMLGTSQAATYAINEICRKYNVPDEDRISYYNKLDVRNLSFVLNRESLFVKEKITEHMNSGLTETLIVSLILLIAVMSSFILSRYALSLGISYYQKQKMYGVGRMANFLSQSLSATLVLYVALLPVLILLKILFENISIVAFFLMPIVLFIIAMYIIGISWISKNESTASLIILLSFTVLLYLAGGILPVSFLPHMLQKATVINPVYYIIKLSQLILF